MSKQKPKHTPGPWFARQEFSNRWRIEVPREGLLPLSVALVTTTALDVGVTDKDTAANARLIAAAPELLESLKEVVALAYPQPLENKVLFAACEAAKSIISKAEGNSRKIKKL